MSLYYATVEISIPVIVEAEDYIHAETVAQDEVHTIVGDVQLERIAHINVVRGIRELTDLPDGWDEVSIPYGGDGNTRINRLLAEAKAIG